MPARELLRKSFAALIPITLTAALIGSSAAGAEPPATIEQAMHVGEEGMAAMHRGDFAAAAELFTRALAGPELPTSAKAAILLNRGVVESAMGQGDPALYDYLAALKLDPTASDALSNLGALYEKARKYDMALRMHRRALAVEERNPPSPTLVQVHNNLAWILATAPEDDLRNGTEAVLHATTAADWMTAHWPDAPEPAMAGTYDTLAAAYAEAGRFDDAVGAEQKAVTAAANAPAENKAEYQAHLDAFKAQTPWRLKRKEDVHP